jgi:hypothetical protein
MWIQLLHGVVAGNLAKRAMSHTRSQRYNAVRVDFVAR